MRCVHLLAFAVMLMASPATAGVVYHASTKITGHPLETGGSRTVSVSGRRYRVEYDSDRSNPASVHLKLSDGRDAFYVNLANRTWYRDEPPAPKRSFEPPKCSKLTHEIEGTATIHGRESTKHVIRADCKVVYHFGEVDATEAVGLTMLLWIAGDLPTIPAELYVDTKDYDLNQLVINALKDVAGMPLLIEQSMTRAYEGGGIPRTVRSRTVFSDIQLTDVPSSAFQAPKDFQEQAPVYGFAAPQ